MYQALVFIHIVCAVIWVGGAVAIQALGLRAQRSDDPLDGVRLLKQAEWVGTRVFLPSSIVLFLAGVVMVAQQWSFGELWISVSMGLWILSALAGSLYLGPRAKKVVQIAESEGPTAPAGLELAARLNLVSRLELLSFAVIIALMVFKPGSGAG